jgi:hypothetical protein
MPDDTLKAILARSEEVRAAAEDIKATTQATLKDMVDERVRQDIKDVLAEITELRRDIIGRFDRLESFLRSKLNGGAP